MIDILKEISKQPHVHPTFRAAYDTHPDARKLAAIVRAYEAHKDDPNARIPTALMCLLEAARA
jgi:hypothetical protein